MKLSLIKFVCFLAEKKEIWVLGKDTPLLLLKYAKLATPTTTPFFLGFSHSLLKFYFTHLVLIKKVI